MQLSNKVDTAIRKEVKNLCSEAGATPPVFKIEAHSQGRMILKFRGKSQALYLRAIFPQQQGDPRYRGEGAKYPTKPRRFPPPSISSPKWHARGSVGGGAKRHTS